MIADQAPMKEEEEEPVGVRFYPTDYELVNHHLKRKLQHICEKRCAIPDVNVYDYDPRDLRSVYNEKSYKRSTTSDCFFFSPRNRVNGSSARNSRQARGGFWRETSTKQDVEDEETGEAVGTKRIFVFRSTKQGNDEQKTEYVMHEYHLNTDSADSTIIDPTAFSVCHVKKKAKSGKGSTKKRQIEKGNPKKQQSKKVKSPYDDAGSSSPDKFKFQESSLNMEEEQVPTEPQEDSPNTGLLSSQQLLISGRSAFVSNGFKGNPSGISYEQGHPATGSGLEKLGSHGSSADFGFHWQVGAESWTPPDLVELPNIEYSDSTAGALFENGGNAAAAADDAGVHDDGLSLMDLGFLDQEWIREL